MPRQRAGDSRPAATRSDETVKRTTGAWLVPLALLLPLTASSCDRDAADDDVPAAAPAAVDSPLVSAGAGDPGTKPAEIYFDLTRFQWYREGRPLVHQGRSYMPQADPAPVDRELKEAGSYEGVTYYVADDAAEPVYTIYVPVYYRYWQRFTAPPGR